RAQVDRITSRQLLDQQLMETKVSELLQRQTQLSQRHGRLGPLLQRAENDAGTVPADDPAAAAKTDKRAEVTGSINRPAQTYAVASLGADLGT
ncbi:M23 family peptidase, partial [Mesorhizobium sp. M1C.F.Ca.ET.188.01.1.1]